MSSSRERFRIEVVKRAQQRLVERRADGLAIEDDLHDAVRTSTELRRAIDRAWPPTTGAALVRRLLTNRAFLARFAEGWLDRGRATAPAAAEPRQGQGGLDPRRRRPGRRGGSGPRWARPALWPPRRGRGPGPLGDGVADGGPPVRPVPLPHRAGRPRPGHRPRERWPAGTTSSPSWAHPPRCRWPSWRWATACRARSSTSPTGSCRPPVPRSARRARSGPRRHLLAPWPPRAPTPRP